MQVEVTGKHMDLTPPIEEYATKKAEKLTRYFDRIQRIEVILEKVKNDFRTEVITEVEHHDPFVAHATDADLYASIDQVMDRSTRQLKDHKSRIRDDKHHAPVSGREP